MGAVATPLNKTNLILTKKKKNVVFSSVFGLKLLHKIKTKQSLPT